MFQLVCLFWRRWRDSNSRVGLSRPTAFRVRTLQPLGYISVYFRLFLTRKIFWREKQERKHKSIRFEILKTENWQGVSGGRNSQIPPKFRVSPIMITSIPFCAGKAKTLLASLSVYHEKEECARGQPWKSGQFYFKKRFSMPALSILSISEKTVVYYQACF